MYCRSGWNIAYRFTFQAIVQCAQVGSQIIWEIYFGFTCHFIYMHSLNVLIHELQRWLALSVNTICIVWIYLDTTLQLCNSASNSLRGFEVLEKKARPLLPLWARMLIDKTRWPPHSSLRQTLRHPKKSTRPYAVL